MIFRRVRFSEELVDDLMPLLKAHFDENASEFYGPFNPDIKVYRQADAGGMLRIFVASHRNEIIGYQIYCIAEHMHSQDMVIATQDILYIRPEHRQGMTAFRFMKWCQGQLREDGIDVVHQVVPAKKNYGSLMERLGYKLEDVCYSMRLSEGF